LPDREHYRKLENLYRGARINEYYRPVLKVSEGRAVLTIPVRPDFHHALGAVHGSVYFKALDDAAFFAVNSLVESVFVLTVSFTVHLVRPISEGTMRAEGRVLHGSRRLWVAESWVDDADGRRIAFGNGTFMKSRIALTAEVGYR